MTEAEWLAGHDSRPMLEHLRQKASERRLLLFAVACCRRIWPYLHDARSRKAVEVVEQVADSRLSENAFREVAAEAHSAAALSARQGIPRAANEQACRFAACAAAQATNLSSIWNHATRGFIAANGSAHCAACASKFIAKSRFRAGRPAAKWERRSQATLLRDIFGNPFHPNTVDSSWRAEAVVALSEGIYQDRAFDRMPILAYALEDAGCDDEDILNHCRGDGLHVRGCWVVDLLTGRK